MQRKWIADTPILGRGGIGARRMVCAFLCSIAAVALFWFVAGGDTVFAQETAAPTKSALTYVTDGGVIGFIILICSVVGFSLAITFAFQIKRDALIPPDVLEQVEGLLDDGEHDEAFHVCEANPSFLSAILASGLERVDDGYEEMQRAMEEAGELETTKLHQKVGYLALIAAVSPMLGLFGTVYGMILTFNTIAGAEVQPKPNELASGISTALVTTFLGLLVAIPMTVLYTVFKNRVVHVVLEVGGIAEEIVGRFKSS